MEVDPFASLAVVDDHGRRRRASTLLAHETAVGDWVLVAAGNVIRRLDADDAAAMAAELARAESIPPSTLRPAAGTTSPELSPLPRPQGDTP